MNTYSERDYKSNGYLSIPINGNNSLWQASSVAPAKIEQRIVKDDPTNFCYYCWYYVTVRTNLSNAVTSFVINISPLPDGGEDV